MKFIYIIALIATAMLHAEVARVTQHFAVVTTKVKKENIALTKELYGYIEVNESRVVEVVPRFSGYVEKLFADVTFDRVRQGEALAKVYSPEVYKAKDEYLRSYNYGKKKGSHGMVRSAKLKLKLLGVAPQEIDAIVKKQEVDELTTIYAPASGFIYEKLIEKGGAFIKAKKLFTIVDLSQEWLRLKVSDADIEWIRGIKEFEVRFDALDKVYKAKLDMIEPKLDPKEALYTVRTLIKNDGKIYPGMYAKVTASKRLGEHLVVPSSALIRKNSKLYAFLVTEFKGEFDVVEVKAKRIGDRYMIIDGLKSGDEVVKSAMFMMDSDAEINQLY